MQLNFLRLLRTIVAMLVCLRVGDVSAQVDAQPLDGRVRPIPKRSGPWENDVLVYRTGAGTKVEQLARFPRAGVSTLARLQDGRVVAAHQHFPENNRADFDKVAVRFSSDEGRNWTEPQVIHLEGLPTGMRFPFDPTLVPLPDGRVRLYFTSLKGQRFEQNRPAIYSAISSNCIDFIFEPGVRLGIEGRPVIDCAAVLHHGVFHLFSPDNGNALNPDAPQAERSERAREGTAYYATSNDGLNFTRQPDVQMGGGRRWLGNVQSDGQLIRFFGTGNRGVWMGTSTNGQSWAADETFRAPGADPGAVKLKDGGWLISGTGPRRDSSQQNGVMGGEPRSPIILALDANGDGIIDPREIENAPALLRKFDRDGDGRLTPDELRPATMERDRAPAAVPRGIREPGAK